MLLQKILQKKYRKPVMKQLWREETISPGGDRKIKLWQGSLILLLIICSWWLFSELHLFNQYLIPSPQRVGEAAIYLLAKGLLLEHLKVSLYRVVIGFIITFLVAFPLAVILGMNQRLYSYLQPFLEFVRHIPPIALIPILILWFGIGEISKLAVIFLATFFPVFLNTVSGVVNCDHKLLEVGQVFHLSKKEELFRIILPQAIPQVIVGMQLGLGYSWRSLIGAELIAASSGIGYMIIEAEQLSRPDIIMVGVLTIGIVGCIVDFLFFKLTNSVLSWNKRDDAKWQV